LDTEIEPMQGEQPIFPNILLSPGVLDIMATCSKTTDEALIKWKNWLSSSARYLRGQDVGGKELRVGQNSEKSRVTPLNSALRGETIHSKFWWAHAAMLLQLHQISRDFSG